MANLRRALLILNQTLNSPLLTINTSISVSQCRPENECRYLLGSVPRFSSNTGPINTDLSDEENKRRLCNRLLYRSKQRGFLELDLVLGNWVEEHIWNMDEKGVKELVDVLDVENPDLWKWLTGQEQPPEIITSNHVFSAVQAKVMHNLNSHAAPEIRAKPGQPWVRGWDDKRERDGLLPGNQ